jgi:hypothetical protein
MPRQAKSSHITADNWSVSQSVCLGLETLIGTLSYILAFKEYFSIVSREASTLTRLSCVGVTVLVCHVHIYTVFLLQLFLIFLSLYYYYYYYYYYY